MARVKVFDTNTQSWIYADKSIGNKGEDGFSPVLTVEIIEGGHRITIMDINSTKTIDVMDGSDGQNGRDGSPGANGKDGVNGKDGEDGNGIKSAVLNADYTLTLTFDNGTSYTTPSIRGATGATGSNGKDGTNGTNGKDGTSVTVKSVSESTADGGNNVVTFSDGKTMTVKNGSTGATGGKGDKGDKGDTGNTGATGQRGTGLLAVTTAPSSYTTAVGGITPKYRMALSTIKSQASVTEVLLGDTIRQSYYHYPIAYLDASYAYCTTRVSIRGATGTTPVKGTDYFTESEKDEMVQEVIAQLGLNVIGEVDNANNILITADLPAGTYTMRYENADGSTTDIGTFIVGGASYTNLADPASSDWLTNKRINSSKDIVDVPESARGDKTVVTTNFLPLTGVSKYHVKGLDVLSNLVNGSSTQNYGRYHMYTSAKVLQIWQYQPSSSDLSSYFTTADYDSSVTVIDAAGLKTRAGYADLAFVRLGGILTGAAEDVIITADRKIV